MHKAVAAAYVELMVRKRSLTYLLLFVLMTGCENKTQEPLEMFYDYFPIEPGKEVLYKVDSIHFSSFTGGSDTFSFYVKEIIDSSFTDLEGRESFRYYVYKKLDSITWLPYKTGVINRFHDKIERVTENERRVHLVFPVLEGKSWPGEPLTGGSGSRRNIYQYRNVHQAKSVLGKNYSSTLQAAHYDEENIFFKRLSKEEYARGYGLISKEYADIDKQGDWDGPMYTIKRMP